MSRGSANVYESDHRTIGADRGGFDPYHYSYKEADGTPMTPRAVEEVVFALLPTSVLFRAGHRIRISIGGADSDTFARVPAEGTPEWVGPGYASHVTLPVIPR